MPQNTKYILVTTYRAIIFQPLSLQILLFLPSPLHGTYLRYNLLLFCIEHNYDYTYSCVSLNWYIHSRCLFIILSAHSDIVPAVILKLCWTFYRLQMPDNYNAVIYGVTQVGVTQSNTGHAQTDVSYVSTWTGSRICGRHYSQETYR